MLTEHNGVLFFLMDLGSDPKATSTLGITHLDYLILYILSEQDILLMTLATDAFAENRP